MSRCTRKITTEWNSYSAVSSFLGPAFERCLCRPENGASPPEVGEVWRRSAAVRVELDDGRVESSSCLPVGQYRAVTHALTFSLPDVRRKHHGKTDHVTTERVSPIVSRRTARRSAS